LLLLLLAQVFGEITSAANVDYETVARQVCHDIGYNHDVSANGGVVGTSQRVCAPCTAALPSCPAAGRPWKPGLLKLPVTQQGGVQPACKDASLARCLWLDVPYSGAAADGDFTNIEWNLEIIDIYAAAAALLLQDLGFNASNMEVKVLINEQVPEIAQVSRHTAGGVNADKAYALVHGACLSCCVSLHTTIAPCILSPPRLLLLLLLLRQLLWL
jgi:hypothetical protein